MKEAIAFMIGLIIGFGCSLLFFVVALLDSKQGEGVVKSLESFSRGIGQEKGHIIYTKTDEMEAMEHTFELNDQQGIDTNIGEIEGNE